MEELHFERGADLKTDILDLAEVMFREYGYDATTFQKIADQLGISKGAITYHFKNKHMIMDTIIQEFFDSIRVFIDSFPDLYRNSYWRYCTMYIYALRTILKNKRNQDLFYHKDQVALWETLKVERLKMNYRAIAKDFQKYFTDEELTMTAYFDLGARARLFREYQNSSNSISIDKFCYYQAYLIGCLARLDEATIRINIEHAFAFANQFPLPLKRLFT